LQNPLKSEIHVNGRLHTTQQQPNGTSDKFQIGRPIETSLPSMASIASTVHGSSLSSSNVNHSDVTTRTPFSCNTSHFISDVSGIGGWGRDVSNAAVIGSAGSGVCGMLPVQGDVGRFGSIGSSVNQKVQLDSSGADLAQSSVNISRLPNVYSESSGLGSASIKVCGPNMSGCGLDCIASLDTKDNHVVSLESSISSSKLPNSNGGDTNGDRCDGNRPNSFDSYSSYSTSGPIGDDVDAFEITSFVTSHLGPVVSESSSANSAMGTTPAFGNDKYNSSGFGVFMPSNGLQFEVDQIRTACGMEADTNVTKQVHHLYFIITFQHVLLHS
jgi:hypothetical protein